VSFVVSYKHSFLATFYELIIVDGVAKSDIEPQRPQRGTEKLLYNEYIVSVFSVPSVVNADV